MTWLAELVEMRQRTDGINRSVARAVRTLIAAKGAASQSEVIAAVCASRKKDDPAEIEELVRARFKQWRFGFGGRARIGGNPA